MNENQPHESTTAPVPRKKRHGCLIGLAAVGGLVVVIVVIAVIAAIAGSSGPSTGTATTPTVSASPGGSSAAPHAAGIGDPVRDGKFEFVIIRVSHRKSVGPSGFGETAQGLYTVLHMKIKNIGNESQTADDSDMFVFDGAGRKFDAAGTADIDVNSGNGGVFLNDINPGNTVHALVLFDLPRGDKAVKAELHDSPFSGGVTVRLGH